MSSQTYLYWQNESRNQLEGTQVILTGIPFDNRTLINNVKPIQPYTETKNNH